MHGRVMGIDPGQARIGVAVSDELRLAANPVCVIKAKSQHENAAEIARLAAEHEVREIVIGLPLHMNGDESPGSQKARALAALVEAETGLPVHLWDERLSTMAVESVMIEAGVSRKKRKGVIDKVAATYILQGWLDEWHLDRKDN